LAIKKQEFYEGAALHLLARSGRLSSVRYAAPFFLLNNELTVLLKYSTKGRSPWVYAQLSTCFDGFSRANFLSLTRL